MRVVKPTTRRIVLVVAAVAAIKLIELRVDALFPNLPPTAEVLLVLGFAIVEVAAIFALATVKARYSAERAALMLEIRKSIVVTKHEEGGRTRRTFDFDEANLKRAAAVAGGAFVATVLALLLLEPSERAESISLPATDDAPPPGP